MTKDTTEKNYRKYNSFRFAFGKIYSALHRGFFIEAIAIEEGMLTDRLLRFCRNNGFTKELSKTSLGSIIKFIKSLPEPILEKEQKDFIPELDEFWKNRSTCIHQFAKSEPGESPTESEDMMQLAKKTAYDGNHLLAKVGKWADRYKEQVENKRS